VQFFENWQATLIHFLPLLISLVVVFGVLWAVNYFLKRREDVVGTEARFRRQMIMLLLSLIGLVVIILDLPISESMRNQLLTLIGLLLTAVITLSSTTVAANAMAGLMMRFVRNIRSGDFIEIEGKFGRVSERGLFHLEIQTEDRDLITFPNQYVVQHPVKVIRSSGTFISATVSLGYDNSYTEIEKALMAAAEEAGLADPFVRVMELNDYSVTYRVSGLLEEVKQLLSARSHLREFMLDKLHAENIEIVSPTFMNQRQYTPGHRFLPKQGKAPKARKKAKEAAPEEVAFDKAELAQRLDELRHEHEVTTKELKDMQAAVESAEEEKVKTKLQKVIDEKEERLKAIEGEIEALSNVQPR
jgi:small conductance mechanosensitive channel